MAWSPLVELVSLDEAKGHLKLPLDNTSEDDDLTLKLQIAHELVMDYLTQRLEDEDDEGDWEATVDAWTSETVPKRVKGAILFECGRLYRQRGDDDEGQVGAPLLSAFSRVLLDRFRDPAIS